MSKFSIIKLQAVGIYVVRQIMKLWASKVAQEGPIQTAWKESQIQCNKGKL